MEARIQIGQVIRNAATFNFRKLSGEAMNPDSLLQTVAHLFATLQERKIKYVLAGGIALLNYIEGRNTEDIDLIMALADLKRLPEIEITGQDLYFARGKYNALQIDLLLTKNPLFEKVQKSYQTTQKFQELDIPTATVEGLILLKLYALPSLYRQGNFSKVGLYENDVATLLYEYQPDLPALLVELSHYLNETDLKSVRQITSEIEQRIKRFRNGSGQA